MGTPFVEEFLYRGRDPEGDQEPAWHLVLGVANTDPLGQKTIAVTAPMTIAQAAEAGWDISKVLASINAEALAHADALTVKLKGTEKERDEAAKERAEAIDTALSIEEALEVVVAERDAALDKLAASIASSSTRDSVFKAALESDVLTKEVRERVREEIARRAPTDEYKAAAKTEALDKVRRRVTAPKVRVPDHLRPN